MENEEITDLDCSANMMWKSGRSYTDLDLNGFFQRVNKLDTVVISVWFCSPQCIVTEGATGLSDGGSPQESSQWQRIEE